MDNMIKSYVETACSCIKWKNYHFAIKTELKNHIYDSFNDYIEQGMPEEEAMDLVLRNMGDPYIIGKALNEAYQPKYNKMLILTVFFPVILFSLCEYFAMLEATGNSFYFIKIFFHILIGSAGGFWLFQSDWSEERRFNRFVLRAYISIIVTCVIVHLLFFPDMFNVLNGMLFLLSHLCCCCIDRIKNRKIIGLIIVMLIDMVAIFIAFYVQAFAGMIMLTASSWAVCMETIRSGWIDIDKKRFGYFLVSIPCLVILLYSVIIKMDNILLNRKGFFVLEIMKGAIVCGRGNAKIASYKGIADYPLTLVIARYGYIMLAVYIICFGFIIFEIIKIFHKQQSVIGRGLMISVVTNFLIEFIFALLLNLGIPLVKGFVVPFLDFRFGIVTKMVQIGLIIKLDCFGNYIFSNYSDHRLFDVEGGKIIIYYR